MLTSLRVIGTAIVTLGLAVGSVAAQSGGAQPTIVGQIHELYRDLDSMSLTSPERQVVLRQVKNLTERVRTGLASGTYQERDAIAIQWKLSPEVVHVSAAQQAQFVRDILPTGMMGFYVSDDAVHEIRPNGWFVRYYVHPVIDFVVPDSPADKSGLAVGDSVIAFDGRDVRVRPVDLKTMNRAGQSVTVRVINAAGHSREVRLVNAPVGKVQQEERVRQIGTVIDKLKPVARSAMVAPRGGDDVFRLSSLGDTIRSSVMGAVMAGRGGNYVGTVSPNGRGGAPNVVLYATVRDVTPSVHGMRVSALTAQLRDSYEIKNGVYVDSVAAESPALQWGFRRGDVVVRVGEQLVESVADARRLIVLPAPGQTLKVEIRRKGDKKTIEIKSPKAK